MVTKKDLLKYETLMIKSNYIIEASYKLNLQEQRLIYILTTKIDRNDTDFKSCRFTQTDINSILLKHKISFNELSQYIDSLRNRELVIIKENSILKTKWLSSAEYFDDGSIELCFDDKLKPYLLQLKDRFTKLSLDKIITFSSNYSCRIYELLKQYENVKERTIEIEALRTMFCVEPGEYSRYNDFKRKVILQAQNEINSSSDIYFDFEEIKTGRKVTAIKFIIHAKKPKQHEDMDQIIKQVQEIFNEDITPFEAQAILHEAKGDISLIKEKYKVVCQMSEVNNIVGAIRQAIREDWKPHRYRDKINSFTNYTQRQYNADDLEKRLIFNSPITEDK